MAKPAEPVNSQDERRIRAAARSPARLCWQAIKGATARSAAAPLTALEEWNVQISAPYGIISKTKTIRKGTRT